MSVCSMIIERMSKVGGEKRGEGEEAVYETVHQVILQPNGGMTCLIVTMARVRVLPAPLLMMSRTALIKLQSETASTTVGLFCLMMF